MMAKNYIKYPEALRFQCEMFSNGYHNSPRIMRLMECIFDWTPTVPQWWKDLKAAEARLIKAWKSRIVEMFEIMKTKAKKIDPRQMELVLFPEAPTVANVTVLDLATTIKVKLTKLQANPPKTIEEAIERQCYRQNHLKLNDTWSGTQYTGFYRSFCNGRHKSEYPWEQPYHDKYANTNTLRVTN